MVYGRELQDHILRTNVFEQSWSCLILPFIDVERIFPVEARKMARRGGKEKSLKCLGDVVIYHDENCC